MDDKIVRVAELPNADNFTLSDSSFFLEKRGELPSPEEVRKKDVEGGDCRARTYRPPPVSFKDRGLLVKYGSAITIAEAQCLWFFNQYMKDTVPVPELYGWTRDGGETFIYMELVQAGTMADAWPSLSPDERTSICLQLRACVKSWRSLRQEAEPYFVGNLSSTFHGRTGRLEQVPHFDHLMDTDRLEQRPRWPPGSW